MLDTTPKNFGRYEVRDELGSGAMGVVYKGFDPKIERDVAIKTIKRSLDLPPPKREEYLERFHREARAAGKLSDHPNIVPVFDVGKEGDLPYIVMGFVEGKSLDRLRRKHQFKENELENLIRDLCSALGYAHSFGTIHRDVKPANIIVSSHKHVLTDFGIARLDGSELTRAGTFLGSPSYMSPEQVRGGELTGASDLFSLAVIVYLLLTGEKPFAGDDTNEILYKIVHDEPAAVSAHDPALAKWDRFFEKALAKKAIDRFRHAEQFYRAFSSVVRGEATEASTATTVPDTVPPAGHLDPSPPKKDYNALPPTKERYNPLADQSMFFNVDVKSRLPSRNMGATTTGRLKRLMRPSKARRSRGSLPPMVWAALLAAILGLGALVYGMWPSEPTTQAPAGEVDS